MGADRRRLRSWLLWMLGITGNTLRAVLRVVPGRDPEALAELGQLRPYYRVMLPEGEGPFPTALLYSGCDGPLRQSRPLGGDAERQGLGGDRRRQPQPSRDLRNTEVWRLICAGQLLMGSERAGDVLVSIFDARRMPFVDPERLVLIGSSHGGWAIMDLLALDPPRRLPFNLAALPDGRRRRSARRRRRDDPALSLLRHGEPGARATAGGCRSPTLFLLSADDAIAPPGALPARSPSALT